MPDDSAALRQRHDAIESRLDAAPAATDREALKAEIIALYKDTEREVAALHHLREDTKQLVERWKAPPALRSRAATTCMKDTSRNTSCFPCASQRSSARSF